MQLVFVRNCLVGWNLSGWNGYQPISMRLYLGNIALICKDSK
jgi:hypothetical protein